jgi:hypothetical protein
VLPVQRAVLLLLLLLLLTLMLVCHAACPAAAQVRRGLTRRGAAACAAAGAGRARAVLLPLALLLLLLLLLLLKVAAHRLAPAKHGAVADVHGGADEAQRQRRRREAALVPHSRQRSEHQVGARRVAA